MSAWTIRVSKQTKNPEIIIFPPTCPQSVSLNCLGAKPQQLVYRPGITSSSLISPPASPRLVSLRVLLPASDFCRAAIPRFLPQEEPPRPCVVTPASESHNPISFLLLNSSWCTYPALKHLNNHFL